MIIDTSAVIAILRNELEAQRFSEAIEAEPQPKMSVVSYVEAGVVADAAGNPAISRQFDELIRVAGIEVRLSPCGKGDWRVKPTAILDEAAVTPRG